MTTTDTPSTTVLEETPARALTFLRGVATTPSIYAALAQRGYNAPEHAEGWRLLHQVAGYNLPAPPGVEDATVRKSIAELDAWDEPNFRWMRAALNRRYPAQAQFLFENLEPATGAGAVLGVSTLLDRMDDLQSGRGRAGSRREDHAALALLAERGITPEERTRLRGLVNDAQKLPNNAPPSASEQRASQQYDEDLRALHGWYFDWAETARVTIKRRDFLLRLGLAKRKVTKKPTPDPKP